MESIGYKYSVEKGFNILKGGVGSGIRGHRTIREDDKPKNKFDSIPGYVKLSKIFGNNLHIEDEDVPQVRDDIATLALFPDSLLKQLGDLKVYIGYKPYPELDDNQYLRNQTPRGWSPGSTWNDVGSAYGSTKNQVCLGQNIHGRVPGLSIASHEIGHAIQTNIINNNKFALKKLSEIHKKYYDSMESPYYQQGGAGSKAGVEEMFASSVAHNYYLGKLYESAIYPIVNKSDGFRTDMNKFLKEFKII